MPELPEVETVRQQLNKKIVGKTIESIDVFHNKTVAHDHTIVDRLTGKTFKTIDRIGKLMIFSFRKENDLFMLAHLKMTGQFFYVSKAGTITGGGHAISEQDTTGLPNKHTRVAFNFTDGSTLYFNDMRLFGYTKLANAETTNAARAQFGPEPIDPDFDAHSLAETLRKRKTPIKAALLDQSLVAGLGNIYVDEALWRAKVHPAKPANTLTKKQAQAVFEAARDVLQESIALGGTTFQHFVDTNGHKGNFTDQLQVFGKQGEPCPRCKTIIKKTRVAGRGTHFCPKCQKNQGAT